MARSAGAGAGDPAAVGCPDCRSIWVNLGNAIGIATVLVTGLVVLTGIGGMTSFGQASFMGFGAYTTALLSTHGVSPWLALAGGIGGGGHSRPC